MVSIETYSPKGLIVKGASAEQAEAIRAALGAAVVTGYNPRFGGWSFSRKREDQIRALVTGLNGTSPKEEPQPQPSIPSVEELARGSCFGDKEHATRFRAGLKELWPDATDRPDVDDDLPGKWGVLASLEESRAAQH